VSPSWIHPLSCIQVTLAEEKKKQHRCTEARRPLI
jgi:hypothetical protein